jgi:hydroxymethylpyrimidine pyrophosphatase-like HAD family hydrolase
MKKFVINNQGSVIFDTEAEEISSLDSSREGISRIWLMKEPMTIVCQICDNKYELNAKKGDIVIKFYDSDFPFPVVIAKSKEWVKNLEAYDKAMQERKEKWAKEKCSECECCDAAPSVG